MYEQVTMRREETPPDRIPERAVFWGLVSVVAIVLIAMLRGAAAFA